jgi:Ni2+-binding GTPase involved in maturation of urease and hydrogenase
VKRLRFLLVGGFLGAGKTTTLARLARRFQDRGLAVGLVTNDQAADLVDTTSLRAQGLSVGEVAGACFCCRFDDLVGQVARLQEAARPDVLLAEPVGSCTDLVATVVQPLRDLYGDRFEVGPYAVLFKPAHGRKILRGESAAGFSPQAAYIFRKQLEEADVIVLNRIDELDAAARQELTALVRAAYPQTPLLCMSARTGEGFEAVAEFLEQRGRFGGRILDIDYDTYAAGEAELGWLNGTFAVHGPRPFALDALLVDVVDRQRQALAELGEVAHLKVIGLADGSFGVANLVSSDSRPELSLPSRAEVREAQLIVNARVAAEPERIEQEVRQAVAAACGARGASAEPGAVQSFRPGRPQPTHRYAAAKA